MNADIIKLKATIKYLLEQIDDLEFENDELKDYITYLEKVIHELRIMAV